MTPYFSDGQVTLHHGHVLDVLRGLPSESVQCVVTSPPYWALRAYGTDPQDWGDWRGELGHEPTTQMFVSHLVDIFREVRRVLKSDGVVFCNLGDSYGGSGKGGQYGPNSTLGNQRAGIQPGDRQGFSDRMSPGLPKSLALIPERFALAMSDDGWYVRSRIAWCKRAPMPESVKDRPTSAWEHLWMLTKSPTYYWDQDAVREPDAGYASGNGFAGRQGGSERVGPLTGGIGTTERFKPGVGANIRNYWLLSPDPCPEAHFATFPREIPRRCIAAASREGDTVLDPFVGSGTTTMVARSMLRRSIGIDLNETYLREIALRKNNQMALMPAPAAAEATA